MRRALPASKSYRTVSPERKEATTWVGSVLVKATEVGIPCSEGTEERGLLRGPVLPCGRALLRACRTGLCTLLVRHWGQTSPPATGKVQRQLGPVLLGSQMRTVPSAEQDARRRDEGLKARPHTASPWPSRARFSTLGSGQAGRRQRSGTPAALPGPRAASLLGPGWLAAAHCPQAPHSRAQEQCKDLEKSSTPLSLQTTVSSSGLQRSPGQGCLCCPSQLPWALQGLLLLLSQPLLL